jgi:transposase
MAEKLGHAITTGQTRVDKPIFENRPEGRRKVGSPRMRQLEGVENDLRELKMKR